MKILFNTPTTQLMATDNEEFNFLSKERLERLREQFDVQLNENGRHFTKEELIENIKDADAVISHWSSTMIDEDVLKAAKNLKICAHLGGTVKAYICDKVFDKGIKVISANDTYFAQSVAEGALTYALVAQRHIDRYIKNFHTHRENGWPIRVNETRGIIGKTVGLVSFGAVAEYFAQMLMPFGCKIKVYSRSISDEKLQKYNMTKASLEEIFESCDIISIHTAFNEKTKHFIGKELIEKIKPGALFINTSRGGVVDEQALCKELETKRFAAALDVFEVEPLPGESKLYDFENVLIIPHRAGPTQDMYRTLTSGILDEVTDYLLSGKAPKSELSKERAMSMSFS